MNTKTQKAVENARALAALADAADLAEEHVADLERQLATAKRERDQAVEAVETYVEKMSA